MIDSVSPSLRNSASGLAGDSSKGSTARDLARLRGRLADCPTDSRPDPERLDPTTLAAEIRALLHFRPRRLDLDFGGARTSAALLAGLVRDAVPAEAAAL